MQRRFIMDVGQRIRMIRTRRGLKQSELAEKTGLSQITVSRIETGRTKVVKPEILRVIAENLDVSVDYLLGGDNPEDMESGPVTDDIQMRQFLTDFYNLNPSGRNEVMHFTSFLQGKISPKKQD
jgi:transcriptional regulator with XRE-family HTH domain